MSCPGQLKKVIKERKKTLIGCWIAKERKKTLIGCWIAKEMVHFKRETNKRYKKRSSKW